MVCKYCNNDMRLDDEDGYLSPYTDYYYQCDKCNASCVVTKTKGKNKKITNESWQEPWDKE